jgi:serine/threonine protein kinase
VLLDNYGNLKITDFGLSKQGVETSNEDSKTFSFCGTPEYLAPEIIQGSGHGK